MKEILVFHVRLEEITPPIWRRFEIRAEGTFWHLHCAIQDTFGWKDMHLHEFEFPSGDEKVRIGIPGMAEFEQDAGLLASWETPLSDWLVAVPTHCSYLYDFGDDWYHFVTLESRRPAEVKVRYPRCTAGERKGPPEDVGGPSGYAEFLKAMSHPGHREHQMYREWVGGPWDPKLFRPEDVVFSSPSRRLRNAGLG